MRRPGRAFVAAGATVAIAGAVAGLGGAGTASAADQTKTVTVALTCKAVGGTAPDADVSVGITVKTPETILPGAKADVAVTVKDGAVPAAPAELGATKYTGTKLTFAVADGTAGEELAVATPTRDTALGSGGTITENGALTGQLGIAAAGSRSLSVKSIEVSFADASGKALGVACTPKTATGSLATIRAVAAVPNPGTTVLTQTVKAGANGTSTTSSTSATTASSSTTSAGTSGTAGELAHTGSQGTGLQAFAMLAGTALLGAIAVLITLPARRRRRAAERLGS